jgi:hypothetical protein
MRDSISARPNGGVFAATALLEKLRTLEITAIVPAPPATNGTAATLDEAKAEFREN